MINRLDDIERRCHAWAWRPSVMCVHPTYINIGFPVALLFTITRDVSRGFTQPCHFILYTLTCSQGALQKRLVSESRFGCRQSFMVFVQLSH